TPHPRGGCRTGRRSCWRRGRVRVSLEDCRTVHPRPGDPGTPEAYMIVGVPKETAAGERRVALVPDLVAKLTKKGLEVTVQSGAGAAAGFLDGAYQEAGARLENDVLGRADIVLKVQPPTVEECGALKEGATLIGML